jgi:hypothetical protein
MSNEKIEKLLKERIERAIEIITPFIEEMVDDAFSGSSECGEAFLNDLSVPAVICKDPLTYWKNINGRA